MPTLGSAAEGFGLTASGTWWHPWVRGKIAITRGGEPGSATATDVADDLGLGGANEGNGELVLTYARHRFGVSYQPLGFDGDETVRRSFVFHGATYPTGERVHSHLDLASWVPRYEYTLIDDSRVRLSAGPRAVVWSFDASVGGTGPGGRLSEHRSFTHVLPALGGEAMEPLGAWFLYEKLAFGLLGSDRYEVDAGGGGGLRAGEHVELELGYRWLKFRFHETTNTGDLTFAGPVAALTLRF